MTTWDDRWPEFDFDVWAWRESQGWDIVEQPAPRRTWTVLIGYGAVIVAVVLLVAVLT